MLRGPRGKVVENGADSAFSMTLMLSAQINSFFRWLREWIWLVPLVF